MDNKRSYRHKFCVACKKIDTSLSYHGFPKESAIRQKWLEILNIKPDQFHSWSRICSKHFHPSCYLKTAQYVPRLLPGSLPNNQNYETHQNNTSSIPDSKPVTQIVESNVTTPVNSQTVNPSLNMKLENLRLVAVPSPTNKNIVTLRYVGDLVSTSNSESLTHNIDANLKTPITNSPKLDHQSVPVTTSIKIKPEENVEPNISTPVNFPIATSSKLSDFKSVPVPHRIKKKLDHNVISTPQKTVRYVGDIVSHEQFSSSESTKRNMYIINLKLKQKNRQIKALRQRNSRLLKKITTLKGLLKQKNILAEEDANKKQDASDEMLHERKLQETSREKFASETFIVIGLNE